MGIREDLEDIKKRRRNVRPDEMHRLLEQRYGKGDDWVYRHPNWPFVLTIDPSKKQLLPTYVSAAIRAIEGVVGDDD